MEMFDVKVLLSLLIIVLVATSAVTERRENKNGKKQKLILYDTITYQHIIRNLPTLPKEKLYLDTDNPQ